MNIAPDTGTHELPYVEKREKARQAAPAAGDTVIRRGLLIGIALLLLSLTYLVHSSINEIEAQNQMITENMLRPVLISTK